MDIIIIAKLLLLVVSFYLGIEFAEERETEEVLLVGAVGIFIAFTELDTKNTLAPFMMFCVGALTYYLLKGRL